MPRTRPLDWIGCHVSTGGGLHTAPARADAMGAAVMQIFTANQRTWRAPPLTAEGVAQYRQALAASSVRLVMSHDSYLINLASPKPDVAEKSLAAFVEEYRRCTLLGIPLLNFHPGAHLGAGEEAAIELVAAGMRTALADQPESATRLVVELTAGQGSNIGCTLEQVAAILDDAAAPDRSGVCVDTAHVYAAGYDIKSEAGYRKFFADFERAIGLDKLVAFHLNDSRSALGSHVDRHEFIGEGALGRGFFRRLVRDRRFADVPMFLETPDEERYAEEIKLLRRLRRAPWDRLMTARAAPRALTSRPPSPRR
ncbi:MAG: deoxyribonuclease IV [Deltaproteobacteria bacterium]|nr:deoxyribonuclease IV [Deltaproteobacteria bacterium]